MPNEDIEYIRTLIEPVLADFGLELVELQLRREQVGRILRIIIYKEEGVTLDDCAQVSREVGALLEVEDPIEGRYHLEVSSPGLDRPLTTKRDFERNLHQKVNISFRRDEEIVHLTGEIIQAGDNGVTIRSDAEESCIGYETIKKAKLVIEF